LRPGTGDDIKPPVRAAGLTRAFAGMPVLAGVDLTVAAAELVVLLGPNGAGKTTLLRVLAGLLRPSGGRLELFGEDVTRGAGTARHRLGYAGHESACYPDLTGRENLEFYAELFGVADAGARVAELLAWAGLEPSARRLVRTYSRGMQQRLALARALLHRPTLLLLDEPFSGLDPDGTDALAARLAMLRAEGVAILLATHDLERAAPLATRMAILRAGRIAWTGDGGADPAAVVARYRAVVGTR
jgi:heme exporter protein A